MKAKRKHLILLLLGIILTGSLLLPGCRNELISGKTKNIILFIGDGMGVTHVTAGMTVNKAALNLQKFPYSGFSITHSADNYITDSAAGGTAIACGVKTNNGMLGLNPDESVAVSVLEVLHENGLATGLVSTSSITHATPASFIAHNSSRDNYEDIALHFLNGSVDVFLGGGENHFRKRADGRDLAAELEEQGFDLVYTPAEMKASSSDKLAGLLAEVHMPRESEGRTGILEEMTRKAIEVLSREKKGFFLMIEGSMIDWGAHANEIDYVTSELIDMDRAVGVALDFAQKDGQTLVVITSDHETGGLSLTGGNTDEGTVNAAFATTDHSASMVPIFSYGPGAQDFSGIHDNTFFFDAFLKVLGIRK
ncbi:MAG: alkaline phosphatase [Bacteroidales bacterium]|nr:alkaline phosphatase [Bacteroidales bacterium]